jgi:alpha-methylacyl-CoA racemase
MLLADLGADVVRIERGASASPNGEPPDPVLGRGKRSIALDLKQPDDLEVALTLLDAADVAIDPFRPGALERLGLGPAVLLKRNPRLVFARMTGWGQDGPLATAAGHDINYVAVAGALRAISPAGAPPVVPLNLIGDYGAGGMMLAFGVVCGLYERVQSGLGQVIDVAIVDGVASMMALFCQLMSQGSWSGEPSSHWLDGSAHWYGCYETADQQYVAIGALEEPFYGELLTRLGLEPAEWPQWDTERWPLLRARLTAIFSSESISHWRSALEGTDVCFAPALTLAQAFSHPHLAARQTFLGSDGIMQPAPAPRFARTPGRIQRPAPTWDADGPVLRRERRWH